MGELGDISTFMKAGSVSNLDWLDVDEAEYRKMDTLPKQNFDIQPDLEALWAREDRPATSYLVPNKSPVEPFPGAGTPHTMGDLSQEHGKLSNKAEDIRKIARLALMQTTDAGRFREEMVKRFDLETLRSHRQVLAEVLAERGLLGKLYVNASDFPGCNKGRLAAAEFVHRNASEAKYLVAKPDCQGCRYAMKNPTGGTNCAVFQKQIEMQVPYSPELAEAVENSQRSRGKLVEASTAEPRERIRAAMLASTAPHVAGVYQGQGKSRLPVIQAASPAVVQENLVQASSLVRKKEASMQESLRAIPVVDLLRREMVKGLPPTDLAKALRLAFDVNTLKATRTAWEPLLKEAGLYGVIYATQDSFDDCRVGADLLAKHNPGVRAIVAGPKCASCIYNKTRCLMYGKPLVKQAGDLYTPETVEAVLTEHRTAGRLPAWSEKTASSWGSDPREALKNIHDHVCRAAAEVNTAPERLGAMKAFRGNSPEFVSSGMTRREIIKQASKYMNEGLYGQDLANALKRQFEPRDLIAAKDDLRKVLAEQGLQGVYFVDPSVYSDYGRGCDEAARLHRSRLVEYVKLGSKCASCVLQSRPGFCSKLNKALVTEPPYADKLAQQREILASGKATEVTPQQIMHNGSSMLAEYQIQNEMAVEVREASSQPVLVEFSSNRKVKF